MYHDEETARKLVELEIANMEELLVKLDGVLEVTRTFNGKVYNKRFSDALFREVSGMYCRLDGNYLDIEYRPEKTYIRIGEYSNANLHSKYISVMRGNIEASFNIDEKGNKRISYKKMCEIIEKRRTEIKKRIDADRDGLTKIDEWKEYICKIKRMAEILDGKIPYDIKDYFGMNYSYRKW